MDIKENFKVMARYNQWMNEKLYQVCAEIPDQERKKDLGAFFKSIHGTLNHLLYGDKAWLGRFTEHPFSITLMIKDLYQSFEKLQEDRVKTDEEIIAFTQSLSTEWLQSPFEYTSNVDQKTRILPAWILVTHLFNHQTHHRGQVTTLIKQLGYEPGITDLPWLFDGENH